MSTVRALFRSAELQAAFDRDGYVVLPFLDPDQVAELSAFYATLDNSHKTPYGFHVSMDNADSGFVQAVMDKLRQATAARVDEVFDDARVFVASFVGKEPGPRGIVPPHQDWTFVDESRFVSCTVWIPLVDTTVENGALGAIRGSHRLFDHVRASPSPQCPTPIGEHMFRIFPYVELVEMKAGQAFIFNNRTLHASPPNLSGSARISAGIGITHAEAELVHHTLVPGTEPPQTECFRVEPSFFHAYSNSRLSQMFNQGLPLQGLESLGRTPFERRVVDADELARWFERDGNRYDAALAERMARLLAPAAAPPPAPAAPEVPAPAAPAAPGYDFQPGFAPMKPVLRDAAQQQALERDGFVVVDLLDAAGVAELARHYAALHPEPARGFYASTFARDPAYRQEVDRQIRAVCAERIAALTQDVKIIFGSYIVKGADAASQMNIHQDMTLVDENEFAGLNVWCPLVDLDANNGALQVLPGSHRLLRTLRGATIPAIYDGVRDEVMQYLQPLHLRAGQAVIFDQSIIHFSPPNRSAAERVVINVFFTHRDARMLICHHDHARAEAEVEVFEVGDDLLHVYEHFGSDIHARPDVGRSLGRVPYVFPRLDREALHRRYGAAPAPAPSLPPAARGWRQWLQRWAGR